MGRKDIRSKAEKKKTGKDAKSKVAKPEIKTEHKKKGTKAFQLINKKKLEEKLIQQRKEEKAKAKSTTFDMKDIEELLMSIPKESENQKVNQAPKSYKGNNKIAYIESQRLQSVLANDSIQYNPFAAVQSHLELVSQRMHIQIICEVCRDE